jgi:hypothetical protein
MINSRRRGNQFAFLLSAFVPVFGRQDDDTIHALLRPASKKRQGTKSRARLIGRSVFGGMV